MIPGAAHPHRPYEPGPFRMTMGLTSIAEPEWLEFADDHGVQMAERSRLLRDHEADVLACLPQAEAAAAELRDRLVTHLLAHHQARFSRHGNNLIAHLQETSIDLRDPPLAVCGHLVQEDFRLMQPHTNGHRLNAAILCFPSRWRLAEKLGRPLPAIHGPVPFYRERLANPVERFFQNLKPGRLAQRLNWSVLDDPTLFQPGGHGEAAIDAGITRQNALQRLHLRVERQTFRKLSTDNTVVFGIRTHITRLDTVAHDPAEAERLRAALCAMPPEMNLYKSASRFSAALLDALAADRASPTALA